MQNNTLHHIKHCAHTKWASLNDIHYFCIDLLLKKENVFTKYTSLWFMHMPLLHDYVVDHNDHHDFIWVHYVDWTLSLMWFWVDAARWLISIWMIYQQRGYMGTRARSELFVTAYLAYISPGLAGATITHRYHRPSTASGSSPAWVITLLILY